MDVLQAVVGGSDGCLFSYGHAGLGKLIPRVFYHFKSERETKERKLSQTSGTVTMVTGKNGQ